MSLSTAKTRHLQTLSDARGIIAAAAMDQRGSLTKALAEAKGVDRAQIRPAMAVEFKTEISKALTPHATAILLDPEFGLPAARARDPKCGLILAYEASGYDNTRPGRLPDLLEGVSVARLADWGANAVKLLVYYSPFDEPNVNEIKHAFVERVGAECEAHGLAFFLEFLGYDPHGGDEKGLAFARLRPRIVIGSMQEFSKPRYKADVLKVETPINPRYTGGMRSWKGETAYSRAEALKFFREASDASGKPFIYLSAGVDNDVFTEQLEMAAEAGAEFSGVLCGRATWKGAIPVYGEHGAEAMAEWLAAEGVPNIARINAALGNATPWWRKMGLAAAPAIAP
jgi:tagatose 1,6-diphosphate aldolase